MTRIALFLFAAGILAQMGRVSAEPVVVSTVKTPFLAQECQRAQGTGADFCVGYILAAFDALAITKTICPGENSSTEQAVAVARKFIADNPKLWNRHPIFVVRLAFEDAFPCDAKR
ncbi:Rap1a/Tai family immunity protein [Methylobacterium brachythecii]|uniref:Rap1a immunity protein domain-containing protein n=1 Tax=Methylobacterium brachythecii TaxID=1176177 RepID=A0A7W6ASF5_9HYPH|nr:Rap1a/Tai family immunity protein [Methylobacterium brachythecii]MBB3905132.1 hypothetical protein [Methylobacterium brachythecii]GLS44360.1 hypothetical protein GCM10007884_23480 [Methylobacterium brachythecii]